MTPDLDEALEKLFGTPLPAVVVERLKGDASTRSYFRVHSKEAGKGPSTIIVMQLPDDAFGSDEGGAQPETTRLPFLEVGELLRGRGIPVPKIYLEHLERGQILLEDLGETTFERRLLEIPRARWKEPYSQAVDLLAEIHERCNDLPPSSIVARRKFDRPLLEWELNHFLRWGLEELFGNLAPASARVASEAFSTIVAEIEAMPTGFVHRDYQSRNLMVPEGGELTIIDFQDALIGPRTYDLVALLCDSYVSLDIDLQEGMIERYASARRIDTEQVRREFWVVTLHRKLKDAGRFVFIDRKRNDAGFLQWYPQSLAYVGRALAQIGRFGPLGGLLRAEIPGFPDSIAKPASVLE
ncbi:MAG: phosphotransferase [Myxococcales bacterium]|nr:phosphotransferase [Myxococcales bacterium]MDH3482603.1 phosphotransferase [Myxococcales bacterium]